MSIDEIVQSWKRSRNISPSITDLRVFEKREGQYCPFPDSLHPVLKEALKGKGIGQLYSHQAEAIDSIQQGKDVVVVTPTASRTGRFRQSTSISPDRLMKNDHLSRASRDCLRFSSLRRTSMYASFLKTSGALHLAVFDQPLLNPCGP